MINNKKVVELIRKKVKKVRDERVFGTLGMTNPDGTVTIEGNRKNHVWVTMVDGTITQLPNIGKGHVPLRENLPVQMIRLYNGKLVLDGQHDGSMQDDVYGPNLYGTLPHPFTSHTDVPDDYTGSGGLFVKVAATEDALEFGAISLTGLDTDDLPEGATNKYYTAERAQDDIAAAAIDTATIDFTYTDATPEFKWDVKNASITYAKIQNVSATDKLLGRATAGAGTVEEITLTAFARSLIDDIDASTARTTLGLVIGTNVQAYDAKLAAIAGTGVGADNLIYWTGASSAAATGFTAFGRNLVNQVDASTGRSVLGLGSLAVLSTITSAEITDNTVTNNDLAQMAAGTMKSNITGSTANAADNSIPTVLAQYIHAATGKTTPVDADELPLIDSAASNVLKKLTWANLKATAKTYFDTLYDAIGAATSAVATHAALTTTHGVTGALVGTTDTQTLSAKTLTAPAITTPTLSGGAMQYTGGGSGANNDCMMQNVVSVGDIGSSGTLTVDFVQATNINLYVIHFEFTAQRNGNGAVYAWAYGDIVFHHTAAGAAGTIRSFDFNHGMPGTDLSSIAAITDGVRVTIHSSAFGNIMDKNTLMYTITGSQAQTMTVTVTIT